MGHRTLFLALLALLLLATTSDTDFCIFIGVRSITMFLGLFVGQGSNGDRTNRPGAMECTTGDAAGDGNTCNAAGADSEQPVTNGEKRGSVEGGAGGEIDANTPELEAFEALIVSIKNSKELTDAQKANVMEEYEATKGWILSRKENEKKKTSNGGGGGGSGSDDDSASDGEDGTTAGSSLSMSVPIKEIRGAGGASGNDNSPGVNSVDNGDVGGGAAKGNDATGGGGGESYFRNKYKHVVAEKTGVKVSSGDDSREDDKKAKQQQQQDAAGADAKGVPTSKKRATTTEEARQRRAEELQKRVESLGKGGGKKGGPPRKKYKIKINNGKKSRAIGSGGTSGNTNSRGTTGDSTTDSSRSSSSSSSSSDSNGGGIGRIPAGSNNNNNNNNGGGGELTKRTILDNNATTDITDALLDVLAPYGNTCFKDRYDEDAEYRFSACFFAEITQQENSKSLFQERKYSLGKWAGGTRAQGKKAPGCENGLPCFPSGGDTRTLYTVARLNLLNPNKWTSPTLWPGVFYPTTLNVTRALTNIATKPIRLSNGYLHELLIDMLYYVSYFLTVVLIVGPTAWEYGGGFLYRRYIMETRSHRGPVPPGGDTRTIRRRRGSERGRENENVTSRDDGDSGRDRREEWTSERVQLPFATAFVVTVSIGEAADAAAAALTVAAVLLKIVWEVLSYPFLVAQDLLMSVLYPEPMNLVDLAYTVLVALALSAIIRNVWPIIYYDYLFPVQPLPLPTQAEVEAFLVYADSNDNGMISRKEALSLFGEMDKFIRMAEIETLWYTVEKAFKRMFEEEERCGYEEAEEILEDLSLFDYHNDWRERYDFADKWGDGDGTLDVEEMLIMVLPDIVPSTRGKWWREYEFPLLDKNRNGRASWEEYLAHMEAYHAMEEEGLALDAMKEQKMLWFYYDVDADRELTPNE
eukprot:jgi/Bigna1/68478/fgenesh1_pg.6_\